MAALRNICLSLLLALPSALPAADGFLKPKIKPEALLPAEQAFEFQGLSREGGSLRLQWTVAPGYYLYRHMMKVSVDSPVRADLPLQLPQGERVQDAEFGEVEIYRDLVQLTLPPAAGATAPRTLRVRYQGCADAGVCYPPQTKLVAVR